MNIGELEGKIIIKIDRTDNEILFSCLDRNRYLMYHEQDCCESVYIEDVVGDLDDLIGSPVIIAREDSNREPDNYGSTTWTFYNIFTIRGGVTIRWNGSSNGYYSESVNFDNVKDLWSYHSSKLITKEEIQKAQDEEEE